MIGERCRTGSIQTQLTLSTERESPERVASVFGCIVNIFATILGSGLLTLPYGMAGCGVWIGIGVFCAMMIISKISYLNLAKAVQVYPGCEFKTLAETSLPKELNWVVDFCVFSNCYGCAVSYLVVMSTLMKKVMESFYPQAGWWLLNRQFWCLVFAGLAFPLVLQKSLDALKFSSFLVVVFVLFSLGVIIYYYMDPPEYSPPLTPVVHWGFPGDVAQFLKVFAIIANAFACSQNIPRIVNTLVNPTKKRIHFILTKAVGGCLLLYIAAAYIGYVTFGDTVDSNVLRSYPQGLKLITFARVTITFALAGSYAVQLHPSRSSFSVLFFGTPAHNLSKFNYFAVTIGMWGATVAVALLTDNLGTINTFIGALAAIPLTFIYPNLFWINISSSLESNHTVWHAWVILILGVLLILMALSTEIYILVTGDP
jgi:amino acid permease